MQQEYQSESDMTIMRKAQDYSKFDILKAHDYSEFDILKVHEYSEFDILKGAELQIVSSTIKHVQS